MHSTSIEVPHPKIDSDISCLVMLLLAIAFFRKTWHIEHSTFPPFQTKTTMDSKFHWFFSQPKPSPPLAAFGSPGIEYIKPRRLKPEGRCFFLAIAKIYHEVFPPKKFLVMSFSCQEGGTLSDIMNDIISHWEVNKSSKWDSYVFSKKKWIGCFQKSEMVSMERFFPIAFFLNTSRLLNVLRDVPSPSLSPCLGGFTQLELQATKWKHETTNLQPTEIN